MYCKYKRTLHTHTHARARTHELHTCIYVLITNFRKNSLSCTRKKNLRISFVEYYKILLKKSLIKSKSNICFNVIFLIEELEIYRYVNLWNI